MLARNLTLFRLTYEVKKILRVGIVHLLRGDEISLTESLAIN